MSELSDNAQVALSALREDVASSEQKERMRARLAGLGLAVGAGTAVTAVSAGASAAVASSAATSGAATSGAASSLSGAASLSVASATSAATTTALSAGAVTATASKLGVAATVATKLASLPLAVKTAALVTVLGSSALPLAMREAPVRHAQPAVVQTSKPAAPMAPVHKPDHVPMKLPVALAAPAPERAPVEDGTLADAPLPVRQDSKVQTDPAPAPSLRAHRKLLPIVPRPLEVHDVASTLAAESALLADALKALRTGDLRRADALLEEHRHKFGEHALLAPERERMKRELAVEVSSSQ